MAFDAAAWANKIKSSLQEFALDARREGPGALYYGLCATALLPLAQALQRGDAAQASAAAIGVAGAVGGGLLANLAQKAADAPAASPERDSVQRFEQTIAQAAASDERVADALDAMIAKLDVVSQAHAQIQDDQRAYFREALRRELRDLGSGLTINAQGSVVMGDVRVEGGDYVAGDKIVHVYGAEHVDWARYYLRQLMAQCNRLPLADMGEREEAETAREVMTLDQVYITLSVSDSRSPTPREDDAAEMPDAGAFARFGRMPRSALTARSAVARSERAVLHGAPGSGKSAFVRQLAADLCAAQLGALWAQWEADLEALEVPDFKAALRLKLLDGKALLVFDGLDEVAPDVRSARDRHRAHALVRPRALPQLR